MNDSVALLELKKKAQKQLRKISEETSVNSERAKALLLLASGANQAEAAEQTTLSVGQVRYWLGRYRTSGMECFPEVNTKKKAEKKDTAKKDKKTTKKSKAKDSKTKKSDKNKKKTIKK